MKGFHQVLRLRRQYQDDLLPAGWIEELVAVRRRDNASFGATSRCDPGLTLSGDGIHAVLECNLLAGSTLRLGSQAWYGERSGPVSTSASYLYPTREIPSTESTHRTCVRVSLGVEG
jgi:hypothetical protein